MPQAKVIAILFSTVFIVTLAALSTPASSEESLKYDRIVEEVKALQARVEALEQELKKASTDNYQLNNNLAEASNRISLVEGAVNQFDNIVATAIASDEKWRSHLNFILAIAGIVSALAAASYIRIGIEKGLEKVIGTKMNEMIEAKAKEASKSLEEELGTKFDAWNNKFEKLYKEVRTADWEGKNGE